MNNEIDLQLLRAAIDLAASARGRGNHPFGALLASERGEILLKAENTVMTERDCTAHAETNLVRAASQELSPDVIARCMLYASAEPCPMCAGAIYWLKPRGVVYALSQQSLQLIIGNGADKLPVACREILARGVYRVEVIGPAIEDEARIVHEGFWT
jgi:tRNA(Arg) A34 adenosine deaminase TadA